MSALKDRPTPTVRLASVPPGHPDEFVGKHITPAEQLRVLLARKKQQGIKDWDRVWAWAVARVRWPHDHDERMTWKWTTAWAEPAFRAAYEDEPAQVDMAVLLLLLGEQQAA